MIIFLLQFTALFIENSSVNVRNVLLSIRTGFSNLFYFNSRRLLSSNIMAAVADCSKMKSAKPSRKEITITKHVSIFSMRRLIDLRNATRTTDSTLININYSPLLEVYPRACFSVVYGLFYPGAEFVWSIRVCPKEIFT